MTERINHSSLGSTSQLTYHTQYILVPGLFYQYVRITEYATATDQKTGRLNDPLSNAWLTSMSSGTNVFNTFNRKDCCRER